MGYNKLNTNKIDINPAKKIQIKNTNKDLPFRVRAINTKNTLNEEQLDILIKPSKNSPIY